LAGARTLWEAVLKAFEAQLGAEHPHTLSTKGNLAIVMQEEGDLAGARTLYEAALKAEEAQLGAEHPSTLNTKKNLGILLQTLAKQTEQNGERQEAAVLYGRAADLFEPRYGKDDEVVVHCRAKARELGEA